MNKTTAVKNPETGKIEEVASGQNRVNGQARHPLAGYVNLIEADLPVSKSDWSDTFETGPFKFKIREVSNQVLLADDDFTNYMVKELGLEEMVARMYDFSNNSEPEAAIRQAARTVLANDSYRAENPELSKKADRLVAERYEKVLLGLDPEGDEPLLWGGLVGWTLVGIPNDTFSYSVENVRKLTVKTKLDLYERILGLSRGGISDARFRRVDGSQNR